MDGLHRRPGVAAMRRERFTHGLRTFRRRCRRLFGLALAWLFRRRHAQVDLLAADVHSVLVCRVNARIGNTLFLTPLIAQLQRLLPHACIDLALACPQAAELFAGVPGVRRIVQIPQHGVNVLWRYPWALRRLRRERYDLAIDPMLESTSGQLLLTLCRARYRLGYAGAHQWAPLTHTVAPIDALVHEAVRPVYLLETALAQSPDTQGTRLQLWLSAEERAAGRALLERTVGTKALNAGWVCGYFAHATGRKPVEPAWWQEFWTRFRELEPELLPLEFLPSAHSRPLDPRWPAVHVGALRELAAVIEAGRLFISTDSGPLHLGSATDVPTVGLFHATDPALYRPLKGCDIVIDPVRTAPHAAADRCRQLWRDVAMTAQRAL